MHKLFKDSRPALALAGAFVVTLLVMALVATAQAAVPLKAKSSVSGPIEWTLPKTAAFAPGAKPKASAKLKTCKVSRYYDGRRIVFTGRMNRFSDTNEAQSLQMKFEVYRKYRERKKYRKVAGTGLGTWLPASDSNATVYIRELALEGIETAAHYKARVTYRWVRSDGSVEFKRKLSTKPCHQRIALPNLAAVAVKNKPVAGSAYSNYVVSVTNNGFSEAVNVPVAVSADGAPPSLGLIESLGPGQSIDMSIQGTACSSIIQLTVDPLRKVRQKSLSRPTLAQPCR